MLASSVVVADAVPLVVPASLALTSMCPMAAEMVPFVPSNVPVDLWLRLSCSPRWRCCPHAAVPSLLLFFPVRALGLLMLLCAVVLFEMRLVAVLEVPLQSLVVQASDLRRPTYSPCRSVVAVLSSAAPSVP